MLAASAEGRPHATLSGDDEQKHSSRQEDSVEENQDNASADNVDEEGSCASREFGWRLHYDKKRNLAFYLHEYTGEVRWIHPEAVGFVMEGNKPLPTGAANEEAAVLSPAILNPTRASRSEFKNWDPYYPQVVMMPSGLMEVHPQVPSQGPMLCGYNRFPVTWNFGPGVIARSGVELEALQNTLKQSPGRRILPPTWETSVRERSPFLPPYPVAILEEQPTSLRSRECGGKDVKQVFSTNEEGHYGTAFRFQHESSAYPESTRRLLPQITFVHPPPPPPFPVHPYQRFTGLLLCSNG
uniref:WW domain-containing protein n=1 Tax=Globisporangium ultimum (strain ATCC 200006 / CBS 805.95 / DAOM BR144) TaxID=431595 RepID=K3XBZ2_GLOUD